MLPSRSCGGPPPKPELLPFNVFLRPCGGPPPVPEPELLPFNAFDRPCGSLSEPEPEAGLLCGAFNRVGFVNLSFIQIV